MPQVIIRNELDITIKSCKARQNIALTSATKGSGMGKFVFCLLRDLLNSNFDEKRTCGGTEGFILWKQNFVRATGS